MSLTPYARVLGDARTRLTLLLGVLVRIPVAAAALTITLHGVSRGRTYGEAGVATMAMTLGLALSGPWRGRLLDRVGLRRTVLPSLAALTVCWALAPALDYPWLLLDCLVIGLFSIPVFSIIRQSLMVAVPDHDRRTALALDAVAVELSFMAGPLIGVWAATTWDTGAVLVGVGAAGVLAGAALWVVDPPLRSAPHGASGPGSAEVGAAAAESGAPERAVAPGQDAAAPAPAGVRSWFTPAVGALFLAAGAMTLILAGCDLTVVAAMRAFGAVPQVGVVLALWCVGSVVGGLVYGALHRAVPALWLLFGLGVVTLPAAWARDVPTLTALLILAGLLCAPTSTAVVDQLGALVPERHRGEVLGWQGSFMQVGSAAGAPVAGLAIDRAGFGAGFAIVAVAGMAIAMLGLGATAVRRRPRRAARFRPVRRAAVGNRAGNPDSMAT